MAVAVVVPFAGDDPHRRRALDWVLGRYESEHPDWHVVVGTGSPGRWCKAEAVQAGIDQTDAELLVIADADVWCVGLTAAVENCKTWAVPHLMVHRLDEPSTDELIATGQPGAGRDERPYRGHLAGGIVVIRRDVWNACPLDPRFVGWGQEDDSWACALSALYGAPWRGSSDLWHLWHPPQVRQSRTTGSSEGAALYRRYRLARRRPALMRALLVEISEVTHASERNHRVDHPSHGI